VCNWFPTLIVKWQAQHSGATRATKRPLTQPHSLPLAPCPLPFGPAGALANYCCFVWLLCCFVVLLLRLPLFLFFGPNSELGTFAAAPIACASSFPPYYPWLIAFPLQSHTQVGTGKPLPLQTQINSEHLVALWSSKWLAGRRRNWGPALSLTTSNRKGAEARTRQNTKYKIQNPSPSGNPWP